MKLKDIYLKLEELTKLNGVNYKIIGYSTLGNPIYAFMVGDDGDKSVFMEGGIHAREYISTLFLIEEIRFLVQEYQNGSFKGGFYIVPLVNPDGVGLVLENLSLINCQTQKEILTLLNNGSGDFSLWKANVMGVDLNVNFNADWGNGAQNVYCPNLQNFVGFYPESERETRVIISYFKTLNVNASLSWHSKGEVIYYGFEKLPQNQVSQELLLANKISKVNGYIPTQSIGSVGGFSDWVALKYKVPALTIELGNVNLTHPITNEYLPELFNLNKLVPLVVLDNV